VRVRRTSAGRWRLGTKLGPCLLAVLATGLNVRIREAFVTPLQVPKAQAAGCDLL
jgi:hypothetical protein